GGNCMQRSAGWARRGAVYAVSMIGAGALVAACGGSGNSGASSSSGKAASASGSKTAVKVAYVVPLTGPAASNGKDEENGFNLGLDHFGRTVDGHKIKVKFWDAQGTPTIALTDAKKALKSTHVNVVEGPLLANVIAAVSPYVMSQGVPEDDLYLSSPTQMNDYQQYKIGFTSGWDGYQPSTDGAKWAYNTMHWHHITTIGDDYAFGWQTVGGFIAEFKKLGGTITKTIWPPTSASDVSPYVAEIPHTTQAVYAELLGPQALNYFTDMKSYGLQGKVAEFGVTTTTDQSAIASAKPTVVAGAYVAAQYCDDIPSKSNQSFANQYHSKYGAWPAYYSEAGYTKAEILVSALKKLNGTVKTEKTLAKDMLAVHIKAPRGPVTISHQTYSPIQNTYICKVEAKTGSARNVPIKTYQNVKPWGLLSQSTWSSIFAQNTNNRPAG
ncbi:MAG: ABC transporter substrate-binding protein, partial [Acidimicrobiales bacterium]